MPATTHTKSTDSYMDLVNEFPLRRLKTPVDQARATKMLLRLSSVEMNQGAADYLDLLVDLIADYEKRSGQILDTSKLTAADLVRHRIEERGLSISALARRSGLPQSNLSEMLNGRRDWSKTAIRALSASLNIRADRFLA